MAKLPLPWAMRLGQTLGWLWFYIIPIRKGVALRNIARALGKELSPAEQYRMIRKSFEHVGMMIIESLRMPYLTKEIAEQLVRREGYDDYTLARHKKRGIVMVLGHIGNFELLAASQSLQNEPVNAVVKDIKNKAIHDFVFKSRHQCRYFTIPPRNSKEKIRETLAKDEIVAFLVDQHLPPHRALVCEFFGQLAATTPAPTRFAMDMQAPIIPAVVFRDKKPGHHVLRLLPELPLEFPFQDAQENFRHNTQRLNNILESWIRERPDQYFWVHKRWKVHDRPQGWDISPALREKHGLN